jgi:competence protein ComEC
MKQFLKFIPIQLTICLVLGILFGSFIPVQPVNLAFILGFLILILSVVFWIANKQYKASILFPIIVVVLSFFIGIATISFQTPTNKEQFYGNQPTFSIEDSQTAVISIRKVLKPTLYSSKYEAEVLQLNGKSSLGKLLMNVQKDSSNAELKVDDQLMISTPFSEIPTPKNPYGFSYKNYLKNQQIYHQVYLDTGNSKYLGKGNSTIIGFAANFRDKINASLVKYGFKNNELAVINALLLGQRQEISNELLENYTGAGAIHILAVSGLHVGIILLILTLIFKPLDYFKHGKIITSILIICLLWMFAIIAGLSASVVRAVTMFTAISIGLYLNRPSNIYNTLIISMFFLLLFYPFYLFEIGFQLSYLAVFAIVWLQPKFYKLWKLNNWILDKFWQLFTVSIAAQLGVLPLSLFYFHQFPGLFFLSNLVIIPLLGFILGYGILVIFLALFNVLPLFLADFYIFIIQQLNNFVSWISSQQIFIIENITYSVALLVATYAFILLFFKWVEHRNFQRLVAVFVSLFVIQIIFIVEKQQLQTTEKLIVFQKNKETVIGKQFGEKFFVDSSENIEISTYPLNDFMVGTGVAQFEISDTVPNLYSFKNEKIVVIDSLGLYQFKTIQPTILVLRQSPKVNLNRVIQELKPNLIIADGSNYKSYISKWEQSCLQNETPFYSTVQNGAYILK